MIDKMTESFRPPFSKGGAVKGAEPLSPSADIFAYGKSRLCLVGSRLHFPSENRQSRGENPLRFKQTAPRRHSGRSKNSPCGSFSLLHPYDNSLSR
ncbi:MAG: hypothetical protein IJF21_03410, partial [Clostridia bacterium]|nr:hypothetical protein [Clostridia bacterium]